MKKIHQQKFKKLNNLRYKPKAQIKASTIKETKNAANQHTLKFQKKPKPLQETELSKQHRRQY